MYCKCNHFAGRYYQYEKKPTAAPPNNNDKQASSRLRPFQVTSWTVVIGVLVVIDAIWFVHRMARTYSTAKMVLYGCPAYIDCKKSIVAGVYLCFVLGKNAFMSS